MDAHPTRRDAKFDTPLQSRTWKVQFSPVHNDLHLYPTHSVTDYFESFKHRMAVIVRIMLNYSLGNTTKAIQGTL